MKNTLDHIQKTTEKNNTTEKNIIAREKEGGEKKQDIYAFMLNYMDGFQV